jgi:2-methylfumaryl-CoA hydratase
MSKSAAGRFFEDFHPGQAFNHPTPRTVSQADQALYMALTGGRFALHSSDQFARAIGYPRAPLDDLLVFHLVFGKTVPDVSLNAVANLGYAACVFGAPVYPGDTLSASSRVVGLKETSSGKTGVVYVHSTGVNQRGETVLDYLRWVMVRKRELDAPAPDAVVPDLPDAVEPARFHLPKDLDLAGYDFAAAGEGHRWDDYEVGEPIDHLDGVTIEEAEHQMATRLYHNTARVHFDRHLAQDGRFGRRIVYGGHVISLARALSFNGLANGFRVAAINGGRHVAPSFAGDTVYAWSEVTARLEIPGRDDLGALRLRTLATKDRPCSDFPGAGLEQGEQPGRLDPAVVLDLDYTVLMPRREA